jgi:hypothetical protein
MEKKIILSIIISVVIIFSTTAQEVSKFQKFQNRLHKGTSSFGLKINFIEHLETGNAIGYYISPTVEYSYFMIHRFSINTSIKFNQNFSTNYRNRDRYFMSQKSIDLSFRYYFFKRGGVFIGAGGSFGHILMDNPYSFGRKFYAAPKIDIGYSYMISNVWKIIDNKVCLNILVSSYVPYKKYNNFDICDQELPFFPFCSIELGVVYHFLRN